MTIAELYELRDRIDRILRQLECNAGTGASGEYTSPAGVLHRFRFEGVKPLEEFRDSLLCLYVWVWSMKDYLKERAKVVGKDPRFIEGLVESSLELQLVADVANRSKHGALSKSRSGRYARLSEVKLSAPQESISRIRISASGLDVTIADTELVEYTASVLSDSGADLGSARDILTTGMGVWELQAFRYVRPTLTSA